MSTNQYCNKAYDKQKDTIHVKVAVGARVQSYIYPLAMLDSPPLIGESEV